MLYLIQIKLDLTIFSEWFPGKLSTPSSASPIESETHSETHNIKNLDSPQTIEHPLPSLDQANNIALNDPQNHIRLVDTSTEL